MNSKMLCIFMLNLLKLRSTLQLRLKGLLVSEQRVNDIPVVLTAPAEPGVNHTQSHVTMNLHTSLTPNSSGFKNMGHALLQP